MELEVFLSNDSALKEYDGKHAAQRKTADELLHKAEASKDKADIEAFRAANDELTATTVLRDGRLSKLQRDWNEQHAQETREKLQAKAGMDAVNGLPGSGGGQDRRQAKSLLEVIEASEAIKSLPRATYGDHTGIKWNSPEARKPISLDISASQFDPRRALRAARNVRNGMQAADEITTSLYATPYQILDDTVPYELFDTTVLDVVRTFPMTNKTATWRKESSLTRSASIVAETGTPSKSKFQVDLVTKTASFIKGKFNPTEEELMSRADALPFIIFEAQRDLRRIAANKILQGAGNGDGTDMEGIYSVAGQTFTKGTSTPTTDNNGAAITDIDAIGYAYQECRVTGSCRPQLGFLHPNQFMPIRLLKNALGDYIYGPPNQPIGDFYILGIRFLEEPEAIDGTGLLGDFGVYHELGIFQGISIEIGTSGNDFENWERTVRYGLYCMNKVRRTSAFEKIVGLTSQGATVH